MAPILLSLAHFCDKHGPKVILVTQTGDMDDPTGDKLLVPNYPTDSYCESCLLHFPNEDTDGVRSMRSFINDIPYVTTQYSTIRYQLLSYIIKKAFSEESMIYDGSPLVFFDDTRGLNLVIGFKLYDENARGNERRYSFIFTVDSKNQDTATKILADHWVFITSSFNKMIDYIKLKHKQKLDQTKKDSKGNPFISSNYLKVNKQKTATNLLELTNDPMLFVRIHKWNSFVIDSLVAVSPQ
ncbi:similar to Saccharomyces cerevisiae YGR057C LST7 Protein possibly involved in a post-Golgi secretory pathway [Maudiozyma barnettii]|uniref:Similar to Saccharomyces cerevisiae YGR057C LST7 Protein possibly involved in a post-Golgi secretory pathway n=1 Tax=Maudiozyma barnettii TaxID=61262 RepID=A0A8H2VCA3_9SACH|nr:Lst7p [Kazachstania barnettii]CAB4252582.1 similar to Saccharomyces cerevisiae YGR057C LST7 Protein possibly involved in a post-Golgi secretory pathway [Kazachstania barnettii]CAD1779319.1 similar to Saccharomyces cerevisiae YGR057C LST7 Protein possibly involved in a post-Golgi secretory pathway [Kazachstania barnettii]